MREEDRYLIKQIQSGDQKAIPRLYERYEAYWFRICLRYARNRNEAQDIFQEGAMQVFKVLGKYEPERGAFKSWSGKIMVHAALQFLKKYQWQQTFEDLDNAETELDWSENIVGKLTVKELIQVIQQLPSGYRVVFNMYEIEGYSHLEIAQTLNISVGTSKSQLSKAKRMLRQKLNILF